MKYRYREPHEMKDSGTKWLEQFPKEWNKCRIKNLVDKNSYYPIGDGDHGSIKPEMYQDQGVPYIRVQNLTWNGQVDFSGMVYISEEVNQANKKSILKPKDLLIAKTGATIGKVGVVTSEINCANTTSSVGKITVDHEKFDYRLIKYILLSNLITVQMWDKASQKSAQPGFNIDDLIEFSLILSPIKEIQKKIADFLDQKTAEFDSVIKKKEKLIERLEQAQKILISEVVSGKKRVFRDESGELRVENRKTSEMKDSGVEWLGMIPEEWNKTKLKRITSKITDGEHISPKYTNVGMPFLSAKDIRDGYIEFPNNKFVSLEDGKKFRNRCNPEFGDILLVSRGATIGRVSQVLENREFCLLGSVILIKISDISLSNFIANCLNNKILQDELLNTSHHSAQQAIYLYKIADIEFPIPTPDEQKKINDFLNEKVNKIKSIIDLNKKQIEKLKEAKQSLISETVTGKIEIL